MEVSLQSHLIDTTIIQCKSFDVLNLHYSFPVPHVKQACSAVLSCESEKMSQ